MCEYVIGVQGCASVCMRECASLLCFLHLSFVTSFFSSFLSFVCLWMILLIRCMCVLIWLTTQLDGCICLLFVAVPLLLLLLLLWLLRLDFFIFFRVLCFRMSFVRFMIVFFLFVVVVVWCNLCFGIGTNVSVYWGTCKYYTSNCGYEMKFIWGFCFFFCFARELCMQTGEIFAW